MCASKQKSFQTNPPYGCNEYREEMILNGLRQRLKNTDLTVKEKKKLEREIHKLEALLDFK